VKSKKSVSIALAGLFAALLASSCNNSFGDFYSIQKAQAQNTTSDFKQASVVNFAQTSSNYYAVMAAVYWRPISGGSWSSLSLPGVGTNYACTGITSDGGSNIYISATSNTDNSSTIYHSGDGGATWSVFGINGISLTVSGSEYDQIDGIWLANGTLYAQLQYFSTSSGVVQSPNVGYSLYWSSTGGSTGSFSLVTGLPAATGPGTAGGNTTPFMGVAPATTSVNCIAYGPNIYYSTDALAPYKTFTASTISSGDGSIVLGLKPSLSATAGLFAWTASHIYLTTSGNPFAVVNSPGLSTGNFISDVQEVPTSATTYELVVGTGTNNVSYTANGYFEGAESGSPPTVSGWVAGGSSNGPISPSGGSSTYSALFASKPVTKLYYDSTNNILFAGISASGLGTTAYGLVSTTNTSGVWNYSGWTAQ
jgi:hypothetical protein